MDLRSPTHSGGGSWFSKKAIVQVHGCGRLETLQLSSPVALDELRSATRRAFAVSATTELVFADRDGAPLSDDAALGTVVAAGGSVYARLPDGVLHDFERQIDQIQQMQIGFLCDELTFLRQDGAELRSELRDVWAALQSDRAAWGVAEQALRHEVEELRGSNLCRAREGRVEVLEAAIHEIQRRLQEKTPSQDTPPAQTNHDVLQEFKDFRDNIIGETKAREAGNAKVNLELVDLRKTLQLEVADREESELRLQRLLRDVRTTVQENTERSCSDLLELRQQLADQKQALALEQRERLAGDADVSTTVQELHAQIQGLSRGHDRDDSKLLAKLSDLDTSIDAERMARQQAISDLTQKFAVIVESFQEEQQLRATEDDELLVAIEATRRALSDVRRRLDEVLAQLAEATCGSRDAAQQLEEESRSRRETEAKVSRTLADMQERLHEASDGRLKELAVGVEFCRSSLQAEQVERRKVCGELHERLAKHHQIWAEEHKTSTSAIQEVSDRLARRDREHQEERAELETHLSAALTQLQDLVSKEAEARERAEQLWSRCGPDEAFEALAHQVRDECVALTDSNLGGLREGIAKVVEAVQQERQLRSEADNKLREDIRQALEKEIRARQDEYAELQQELGHEIEHRQEVVEVIQQAIEELRSELVEGQAAQL